MRIRNAIMILIVAMVGIVYGERELILLQAGEFLLVDQPAHKVDAAIVFGALTPKVVSCYQRGDCPQIYVLMENFTDTWNVLRKINLELVIRKDALEKGIHESDLVILKPRLTGAFQSAEYLKKLFQERNIHSAVFYMPYYKTRNQRFYLDRYVAQADLYVQPLGDNDAARFDHWWENTMLDNLFADEYMEILFYYFNKLLWSPFV